MSNDMTVYDQFKSQIQTGDCIAYSGNSIISTLIKIFSPGVSHVGLALNLAQYAGQECRRWTLEANAPGVELMLLSNDIVDYNGSVWWYALKDEFNPLRDKVAEWALCQVGVKYDFASLFKSILGHVSLDMKKFFCSSYDYAAWMVAGITPTTDVAPKPSDIVKLSIFKEPIQFC